MSFNLLSAAIAITFASILFQYNTFIQSIGLASAVLASLLTATTIALSILFRRSRTKIYQRPAVYIIPVGLILLAGVATALQIATYAHMPSVSSSFKKTEAGTHLGRLQYAGYLFGISSLIANILLALALPNASRRKFSCLVSPPNHACDRFSESRGASMEQAETGREIMRVGRDEQQMKHTASGLFVAIPQPPPPVSRPATAESMSPSVAGSFKFSTFPPARSRSSRSRYLLRRSTSHSRRESVGEMSVDLARESDGFDNWDTSTVDSHTRDTVMDATTSDSLNAPLTSTTPPSSPPSSPTQPSQSHYVSMHAELGVSSPLSPPRFTTVPKRQRVATDQSHVHPLFRATSPTPPPSATPGSVIVAAPFTCEAFSDNCRKFTRLRSNSRPSPLRQVKSFDDGDRMQTPSPPVRETTPPIPDCEALAKLRTTSPGQVQDRGSKSLDVSR